MGYTHKTQTSYHSSQGTQSDTYIRQYDPSLAERVARLEADMYWVKKLVLANVTISTISLLGIIVTILMMVK